MPTTPPSWTYFWTMELPSTTASVSQQAPEIWYPTWPGSGEATCAFFTEHIHDPEYFGLKSLLKTGYLFGIQHIYGDLTRADGKDPLDFPAFLKNPTEYEAVVTNALTGKPEYFGKDAMKQDDYRPIMAFSSIPSFSV